MREEVGAAAGTHRWTAVAIHGLTFARFTEAVLDAIGDTGRRRGDAAGD
ncbi:hypothetical protein [Mycobacterium sp.]